MDGRTRFLRNVGGLWLLQECLRTWSLAGDHYDLAALLAEAGNEPMGGPTIDVDDPQFIAPHDMPTQIATAMAGKSKPTAAGIVRCILDSLAVAYARTVNEAAKLADKQIDVVHIVGGGSQNELLCQLTANATGLPVIAGPIEATAIGNIMLQARTISTAQVSLEEIRAIIFHSFHQRTYTPS